MSGPFKAILLDQVEGKTTGQVTTLDTDRLPAGDVLIDIDCSTLNYKDALAITGAGKIIRNFPFVPGIDFAGTVASSDSSAYKPGDKVVLTGWGVGERHWGGLAQQARVKAEWLVPLPDGLTLRDAMSIGTAGFTAMLAVVALAEQGVAPEKGEIVVTGAAGGVGSLAVSLLAGRGYRVVASTGRAELADYLKDLGAAEVVDRTAFSEGSKAPLDSARWAGGIDSVGGDTLVNLLKGMQYHGVVASCGLAGSAAMTGTVFPFILRGVRLIGIDSVTCPIEPRLAAWRALAAELSPAKLKAVTRTIGLADALAVAPDFLGGKVKGRLVVDVNG